MSHIRSYDKNSTEKLFCRELLRVYIDKSDEVIGRMIDIDGEPKTSFNRSQERGVRNGEQGSPYH